VDLAGWRDGAPRLGEHAWRAWIGGLPFALVLALGLGAVLVVGAELSHAIPSAARPFGWPGPASLEAGVATMRPELVLAASLPALLWGLRTVGRLDPRVDRVDALAVRVAADALLLVAAVVLAGAIGAWGASAHTAHAFWGFVAAHAVLALCFYALGVLARALTRRHAVPLALGAWVWFVAVMEDLVQARVMREAGYHQLIAGQFPSWFYAAQALSPVSLYRGVLILWSKGFRDWTERAALDGAALPDWMTAGNFVLFALALWVALPLAIAGTLWWWRGRTRPLATAAAAPAADAVSGHVAQPEPADE
jgi:hypothetical protein